MSHNTAPSRSSAHSWRRSETAAPPAACRAARDSEWYDLTSGDAAVTTGGRHSASSNLCSAQARQSREPTPSERDRRSARSAARPESTLAGPVPQAPSQRASANGRHAGGHAGIRGALVPAAWLSAPPASPPWSDASVSRSQASTSSACAVCRRRFCFELILAMMCFRAAVSSESRSGSGRGAARGPARPFRTAGLAGACRLQL
eukprot:scaffold6724_cov104-Isochrysis_galbana.AAC.5